MKKIVSFLFLLQFSLIPLSLASFATPQASPWTEEAEYGDRIVNKLGFGLLNVSMGWSSILFEATRSENIYFFPGLAKGVFFAVTNTGGGALQAVTFPSDKDIPLPGGGVHFE